MTGPYPPPYGTGPGGPQMYPEPYPTQSYPYPAPGIDASYPGTLPPPVQYPPRKRRPWIIAVVALLAVVAVVAVVTAVALSGGREQQTAAGALTEASAQAAIQDYLDALTNGDAETVARHTLCGLFDAVKERRSDMALAGLSSDAFRKQYESAEVTSIDKMVLSSPTQAQVLFTMRVVPASMSSRNQPDEADEQAVAQVLSIDDEILVCSYLPRTAGQY
jgi:ketosteroid isomerase-like protein